MNSWFETATVVSYLEWAYGGLWRWTFFFHMCNCMILYDTACAIYIDEGFPWFRGTPSHHPFLDGNFHEISPSHHPYKHLKTIYFWGSPHDYGKPQSCLSASRLDMQAMGVYNSCVMGWWSVRSSIYFPRLWRTRTLGRSLWCFMVLRIPHFLAGYNLCYNLWFVDEA